MEMLFVFHDRSSDLTEKKKPTVTLVSCFTWAFGLLRVAAFSSTHAHIHTTSARTQVEHTRSDAGRPQCASHCSNQMGGSVADE